MGRFHLIVVCVLASETTASAQRYLGELPLDKKDRVTHLAISPDSLLVAVAGYPGRVKPPVPPPTLWVYDIETLKCVHAEPLAGEPYLVAFRPDGSLLSCVGKRRGDEYAPLVQIRGAKWKIEKTFTLPTVSAIDHPQQWTTLSPKADMLICWRKSRWLFFGVDSGKELFSVEQPRPLGPGPLSPDGRLLPCVGKDRKVRVIDTALRKEVAVYSCDHWGGRPIQGLAFTPDGKRLAMLGPTSPAVVLCDPGTGEVIARHAWRPEQFPARTRYTPDGKAILGRSPTHGFALHDVESGKVGELGVGKPGNVAACIAFSDDGGLIAWSKREGPVHLWRLKPKKAEEL